MIRRSVGLSLALIASSAAAARSQGVVIDHKAVGCIVVGKYPKMDACFTPAADLARSRVYFRPEGVTSWYYVDMKADQPCFTGTLPRPGKKLVGKKIEYYVEAQNKTFEPARTAEYAPIVVRSAQECKKDVPVAPFLNNATVAVFPAVPAGFVGGGIGTAAIVGIVGAGAAAAGTAAVVASNNNDTTTTTTVPVVVTPTVTTTLPPTTPTTTLAPKINKAPFAVLTTNPDPPSGQGPLTVTFDLCKSTDPDGDPLSYFFNFGDGSKTSGSCIESHTYQSTFRAAVDVRRQDRSYEAEACVVDTGELSACRSRTVNATSPPPITPPTTPPTTMCTSPPTITLADPEGGCYTSENIFVSATATNTNQVTFTSLHCTDGCGDTEGDNSLDTFGPFSGTLSLLSGGGHEQYLIFATAKDQCGGEDVSTETVEILVDTESCGSDFSAGSKRNRRIDRTSSKPGRTPRASWSSDLSVEGGRLQVVINGSSAVFPGRGRALSTLSLADGENRVEAVLVEAAGKAGLWRIDFTPPDAIQAGSLRIISGDVVLLGPTSATFRLRGTQGERIAFTFLKR